jgi:hypothetical protein
VPYCLTVTLDGGAPKPFFRDSTHAYPVASGKKIVYYDGGRGKEGWWIASADAAVTGGKSFEKRLVAPGVNCAGLTKRYFYFVNQRGELWRLNFFTEQKERLKGPFPGLVTGYQIFVRDDDKEILYGTGKLSGKLVLIENVFQ